MSLFSSAIMDTIPREKAFSRSSLVFLERQQALDTFEFEFPSGTDCKSVSTGHDNRITIGENRDHPQSPPLFQSLPQKRSSHSLNSGRTGDPEESQPRALFGFYSAKRFKGPIRPRPLSSCDTVITASLSRQVPGVSEAEPMLLERAEATDDQLESDRSKLLRSPFEYTRELATNQVEQIAERDIQHFSPRRPLLSGNSLRYIYFPPTNPSDTQTLDPHCRVPYRQLLYRGSSSKAGPRSLHKSPGSCGLRYKAERHAEDHNLKRRLHSTSNTSTAIPFQSEPRRSSSRLWLELLEQEDEIQEAVSIQKLRVMQK